MQITESGRRIKLGIIGHGARGAAQMRVLLDMADVDISAVCDQYADRAQEAGQRVAQARGYEPFITTHADEVLCREDNEAVVIMSDWETHIPLAIAALRHNKPVAMEVGGADSIDQCWEMVRESQARNLPVMLLENCCYNRTEMALLNMVRQGLFGTLVHCRGAYAHDLRDEIGKGDIIRHYRQHHFFNRSGELYPTHELGPIAKYLNINRGNRLLSLCSMSSKAVGLSQWLGENRPDSPLAQAQVNEGDVVTTMIKCARGETILLTHDCTLPRPYSRGGVVQGSRGIWMEDNRSIFIEGRSPADASHWTHRWESDAEYMKEFRHPLWGAYENFGLRGGHDGMDYLVLRAFVESVQRQEDAPIDVYDTASWMCITALSEQSIALGGAPVPVPDFTNGAWMRPAKRRMTGIYSLDE